MIGGRFVGLALTLAFSLYVTSGSAFASVRGFDTSGNPAVGFLIMLLLLLAFVGFALLYRYVDLLAQRRIDRLVEHSDIDGLLKALGSRWLGAKAARALGRIGDERAVDPLISALEKRNAETREAAVDALGALGDERAIGQLNTALHDKCYSVREHARTSIDRIRHRAPENGNGNGSV